MESASGVPWVSLNCGGIEREIPRFHNLRRISMKAEQKEDLKMKSEASIGEVDAIDFLMGQHREVEDLLSEIGNAGDRAKGLKKTLLASITEKLMMHTKIEEAILYPAAKEADSDLVLEAIEEHANVKAMLRKLQRTPTDDETFDAKIIVLQELVSHHVKEEEQDLFPKCRKALGDEAILELGASLKLKFEGLEKSH